jgi:hypothetical protein
MNRSKDLAEEWLCGSDFGVLYQIDVSKNLFDKESASGTFNPAC